MSLWSHPLKTACLLVGEYVYPCLIHGESVSFSSEQRCWPPRRTVRVEERWEQERGIKWWRQSKAFLPKLTLLWLLSPNLEDWGVSEEKGGVGFWCGSQEVHMSVWGDALSHRRQTRGEIYSRNILIRHVLGSKLWNAQSRSSLMINKCAYIMLLYMTFVLFYELVQFTEAQRGCRQSELAFHTLKMHFDSKPLFYFLKVSSFSSHTLKSGWNRRYEWAS